MKRAINTLIIFALLWLVSSSHQSLFAARDVDNGDRVPAQPQATIYYVDAVNGSNTTGDGSSSSPWQTITYALTRVSAGDTIVVRPGTYNSTLGEVFPINLKPGISLIGSGRDTTIVAGQSNNTVIYIGSSTTDILSNTLISNITVRDGNIGLQIYSSQGHMASPTIVSMRSCQNNTGIYMSTSDVYQNGAVIASLIADTDVISNSQIGIYIYS